MEINLLSAIIFLPFLGSLFVSVSKNPVHVQKKNALNTAILTIIANVMLILLAFYLLMGGQELFGSWVWNILPQNNFLFKADLLSLLLVFSLHLAALSAIVALRNKTDNRKELLFLTLLYLGMLNGYLFAANIFSFFIFFSLMILPLLMQIGYSEKENTTSVLIPFFVYNTISSFILWVVCVLVEVKDFPLMQTTVPVQKFIMTGTLLSMFFRLPVWPFYRSLWSWVKNIDNPLTFFNLNLLPITGIYGLIRFGQTETVRENQWFINIFGVLCLISMLGAVLRSFKGQDLKTKMFSYILVYDSLYLIGALLPTDKLQNNIGYSLFSFIILLGLISALVFHIDREKAKISQDKNGILCMLPKASFIYSLTVFAAIGLPVTSLFWNNFLILSEIFDYNLFVGNLVMLSIAVLALSLMNNLYILKDRECVLQQDSGDLTDVDTVQFAIYSSMLIILVFSFLKPLWFVF